MTQTSSRRAERALILWLFCATPVIFALAFAGASWYVVVTIVVVPAALLALRAFPRTTSKES